VQEGSQAFILKYLKIKTPLLAAEAFPILRDSDSGRHLPRVSAVLRALFLTYWGILADRAGALG
jgi:hypothetical protein